MRGKLLLAGLLLTGLSACATMPSGNVADAGFNAALLNQAPPELAQAIRANPRDSDAWFQLGNGFAENDQLINAESAYREALRYGPNVKAQHNLGLVHIRLGIEALRSAAEQLPADHPTRIETRQFLALMAQAGY